MAIKKSELYSALWKSCDELRGGMDASQYKDYVLVLLFMKYVSDKYAGKPNPLIEVPRGGSFQDMVALKGTKDIGDGINKIIARLAEVNDLKGVIDVADFNNEDKLGKGKEMVDRLTNLISIFENPSLDFSRNRADGDDLLGDAYEYLMRNFATESGKSKGQFYTPAEVSRVIAKVIGIDQSKNQEQTIYDPACGSGSLLLKAADESRTGVTIYGQEMDNATAAMARMNMILHENPTAEVWKDNTLSLPHYKHSDGTLKTFDFVVANPPFSTKAWSNGFDPEHDLYDRFEDGIPPNKNGDYAFLLHVLRSMKSTGKGAIVMPHGVLFRGNAEGDIRRNLINKGYIKGIISLPPNLFYGTGIPACIILLDKENAGIRKGIFMIDASKGFLKDGNKNRLRHQDIRKIVDVFNTQLEVPGYSRLVANAEILENDFNLNIPRYIDSSEPEDLQDIEAHLKGGIPNRDIDGMGMYWQSFPSLKAELFTPGDRENYSELKIEATRVKEVVNQNTEFVAFRQQVTALFQTWVERNIPKLKALKVGDHPKELILTLSEDLLKTFTAVHLIDKYDIYQYLMDYWTNTMQDDVDMIVNDGWTVNAEMIPADLIINRYFQTEQEAFDWLTKERDTLTAQIEEMEEENSGEEGVLEELKSDKGKISKTEVVKRIKEIKNDPEFYDELAILNTYLNLLDQEAEAGRKINEAQKGLTAKVNTKYQSLSEDEIRILVVSDKWIMSLRQEIESEVEKISQNLTHRAKDLAGRFAVPISKIEEEIEIINTKVNTHLQRMGFTWERAINQGVMQEILTGKRRLPGFSGNWETKKLGEIGKFSKGKGLQKEDLSDSGLQLAIPYTAIYTDFNEIIRIDQVKNFTSNTNIVTICDDYVLFASSSNMLENIGKTCAYINREKVAIGGDIILYETNADVRFIAYLLNTQFHRRKIISISQGSTIRHIYSSALANYEIKLPYLSEQRYIADILFDMDTEISKLEESLKKTILLKQGMMQELLTGRIRLQGE
ncbi:MAG: type I restriction-modification system subunit M [Anaerolineaceae bacterium]